MRDRPQRLHMQLSARVRIPVKAPRHEMMPSMFLIDPALLHLQPGRARHQRIGILDPRILRRIGSLFVAVHLNAVKLDQPIAVPRSRIDLP